MVGGLEVVREGNAFALGLCQAQGLKFFAPLQYQLVFILQDWRVCGSGGVVRHVGNP
ncbi:MAG: hypothetical protein ACD_23C00657G0001 [uncultured bacterium]|nr:MAG: hypothetical protein ACD_23C00657G0001 [uncultured bacterium]